MLLFVGNYLYGKLNGHGKEYDDEGRLMFEGEYLNVKRHGYGKEFELGCLKFEGEYQNDQKWKGKIREYYLLDILLSGEKNININGCKYNFIRW